MPWGTPGLPIPHMFLHRHWDATPFEPDPQEPNGGPVGVMKSPYRYNKGHLQPGWVPPSKFIGTKKQWQEGSVVGVDEPLEWFDGFCLPCREAMPLGCGWVGKCDVAPNASALWYVTWPEGAPVLKADTVHATDGCAWDSSCYQGCPSLSGGTAWAWSVQDLSGLLPIVGGVIVPEGGANGPSPCAWSNCCSPVTA